MAPPFLVVTLKQLKAMNKAKANDNANASFLDMQDPADVEDEQEWAGCCVCILFSKWTSHDQ